MAREESGETRVCGNCRIKVAIDRPRCPRCRVTVTESDPAREAARSKRLAMVSGSLLAVALVALGGLYLQQPAATAEFVPSGAVADPLAARRAAAATAAAAQERPADEPPAESAEASANGDALLTQYREAVQRQPDDADARTSLAQAFIRLKRVEEALPHFERAIAIDPQRPAHHVNLASALAQLRRWEDAVVAYRRAQQLQPGDSVTTLDLAKTLHKKGDDAGAVEEFQKAIALDPNDASIRISLAESYEALNRHQEAADAYNEYLKVVPSGPNADRARSRVARLTSQKG